MPRGHRRGDRKKASTGTAAAVERAERTAIFGKTKMCKFYILGVCAKGRECCFAHDPRELNPAPDLSRTKICKTLINTGFCDDPRCKYAHNKEELRTSPGEDSPRGSGPLDQGSRFSESTPSQPLPTQGQQAGWKPGQQMSPELMQQLASSMAVQMTMLQMAMQANANRPDISSCPALPLAALTQQGAFSRQHSTQSDSSVDCKTEAALPLAALAQQGGFSRQHSTQSDSSVDCKMETSAHIQAAAQSGGAQRGHMGLSEREKAARQNSAGFRQGAAVTLADALETRGSTAPAPPKDKDMAEQIPPHLYSKGNPLKQGECAAYAAGAARGVMPPDVSCSESVPNQRSHGQEVSSHGAGPNLVVKNTFYDVEQSPITPAIHHSSTWAGSLNAVASQEKLPTESEDPALFEGAQEKPCSPSAVPTVLSIGSLATCEKRMQDTPIFSVAAMVSRPSEQELHTVYEGDTTPTEGYPGDNNNSDDLDEHPAQRQHTFSDMGGVTVKNTFLEFAPAQPLVGMRSVQTASGRLDCLDSWGQE